MSSHRNTQRHKVAVIYPYFAHYREPKIHALINDSLHHYDFFGETHSFGHGIKVMTDFPKNRFHRMKGWVLFGRSTIQPGAIRLALGFEYDTLILWGNCLWPTMWIAAILGRLRGKRVLFFGHGWIRKECGIKKFFRNTFFRLAHGMLIYGHRSKCIGIEDGFDPAKLYVIYNSLDCAQQDSVRSKIFPEDREKTRVELFGERANDPVLINITRLHHYKKMDMLIRAAAELKKRSKPVNIIIIGEGPHRAELEQLAKDCGVNAIFTGALYDELEIGKMLNASDLAVMPGPVGLLVMHALAYGVPVISNNDFDTQMPEFEAIIPGVTGDFFDSDNVPSLADAVERMLDSPLSYEEHYEKARSIIERFYNPRSQLVMIDQAVEGHRANDLIVSQLKPYPLSD